MGSPLREVHCELIAQCSRVVLVYCADNTHRLLTLSWLLSSAVLSLAHSPMVLERSTTLILIQCLRMGSLLANIHPS